MARTFVVQTLSQISSSLSTIFRDIQPPDFSDCWTDKDAFLFLDRIRRDLGRVGDVIWILDGLDHCDESSHWFISEILSIAELSEQSFKILITTEDDSHIRESLSHFPVIDLTRSTDDLGEEAKLDFLSSLYQERPQFHHVEPALCHLLASCRDDNLLRDLLREWLVISPCHSTIKALEEELESLTPLSATVIFEKALDTVAEGKRPWARNLIMWLLRSARPLSPGELASALTLDHLMDLTFEPSPSTDLMRDAKHCLGPLISVDDGFIRLSHPGGRDVFTSVKPNNHSPWYTLSSPDEDHRTIADLCARHLSLPKVQEEILNACRGSFRANPIFESPLNISSYAIQYWRWHYHQGYPTGNSIPLTLNMTNFLQDEKSLRCWAAANWHFSNLHMRAKSSFITSLPIVASLGFDKLVASTVETPSFKDTVSVSLAITEAARHGHEKVVEVLLRNSSLELSDCLGAMITASRSAEFGVCRVLVGYAIEHFEKIQWPGFLTSRLAYLGPADLLETILQAGADTDVTNPRYPPPIHCAIAGNSHEAVKSLKSHGADLDFINTNWKDTPPLLVAAKFGRVNMIKTLETAAIDKQDKGGATALWTAAITGQHAVMEALLVAGADRTILEVPLTEKDELAMFTMADLSLSKCLDIALKYEVNPNCKVSGRHPSTALGVAAKRGFTSICRTLIDNGAHIQSGDEPLIVYATMSGQQDVVEVFIEQEANLDVMLEIPGFHGSPLIAAAEGGYLDIAKRLIQKGAKCDQRNNKGSTPMCMSAVENHAEMAKLLIDAGADPTLAQDSGWAPIHKCYDLIEPLKVLLDAGVNVDSSSPDGTPLYLAAYHNHLDAVKLILSYKPFVDTRCPEGDFWDTGYTALHMAAYNGSTEMIRMLLEAGADSNIKTPKGASPLIVAAVKKREESIKILLEYNVDLEIVDSFGDTVIHCMKAPTPLPIAKRLINRGANLKFRNKRRQTILDRAVANRDIPFVELLLDMKADINATDGVHGAALHRAVAAGDIEMSKLLISRGADVDLVHDWMHGTSLQAVFEWADSTIDQKDAIARYLLTQTNVDVNIHGGILGSALNSAILHGSLDIIKLLLERGADTRHPDPWGRQPLHLASLRSPEHVRLLLDSESADNVGIANKTVLGQTALHFAVATGNKDLVELILSESQGEISINQPDGDGWTPLLWACRPCDNWGNPNSVKADMIKLLLDHGADPWIQGRTWDDAKWSPLKMARYHGADDDAVQLLLATEKDEDWDEKAHVSKEAARLPLSYCDVCLFVSLQLKP
jgi:ankyrin repeat protein